MLVTSRKNYLIAPAGGVEPDESIYDAALREAKEEVSLYIYVCVKFSELMKFI